MISITDLPLRRFGPSLLLSLCAACSATDEVTLDDYLNRVGQLGSYDTEVARNAAIAIRQSPPEPTKAVLRACSTVAFTTSPLGDDLAGSAC